MGTSHEAKTAGEKAGIDDNGTCIYSIEGLPSESHVFQNIHHTIYGSYQNGRKEEILSKCQIFIQGP